MNSEEIRKELKAAMDDLKGLLADAQNRIGIIEAFLYLAIREEKQTEPSKETPNEPAKENLNEPTTTR